MSVDTYLRKKSTANYQLVRYDGIEVLVSHSLARKVGSIHLDLSRFMFWKSLSVEAEAIGSHVHGPQ